jgi:hypothetical protein
LTTGSAGAEETGFGFFDNVLDALDGFPTAEVFAIFSGWFLLMESMVSDVVTIQLQAIQCRLWR